MRTLGRATVSRNGTLIARPTLTVGLAIPMVNYSAVPGSLGTTSHQHLGRAGQACRWKGGMLTTVTRSARTTGLEIPVLAFLPSRCPPRGRARR